MDACARESLNRFVMSWVPNDFLRVFAQSITRAGRLPARGSSLRPLPPREPTPRAPPRGLSSLMVIDLDVRNAAKISSENVIVSFAAMP
jgi:hypothetical protein